MPYDADVVLRIDNLLGKLLPERFFERRKMFGGVVYMLGGNMCFAVVRADLMFRVGVDGFDELVGRYEDVREMDFTGFAMKGWGAIDGYSCDIDCLKDILLASVAFVEMLPSKVLGAGGKKGK